MIRNFTDGDLVTSGDHFVKGKEATKQAIIRRLRLFLGEYFLDGTAGTPWFQAILGKTPKEIAEINLKQRIVGTPGVIQINEFLLDLDRKKRKITVQASILDINNEQFSFLFDEDLISGSN